MTDAQPDSQPAVPPVPSADGTPPPPAAPPAPPTTPAAAPPAPGYAAYGQPPQGQYAPPNNTLAIVAMVLSIAGIFTGITAIVGAILGHVALGQIKRTGEGGRQFAITAIIVGWVLTGLIILAILAFIAFYAWVFSVAGFTTYG